MSSHDQPEHIAWRAEAGTLSDMTFQAYRSRLIYETRQIKDFLAEGHGQRFIISAPKGYGKTLLLIAKKKQIDEKGGFVSEVDEAEGLKGNLPHAAAVGIPSSREIVDRPAAPFPIFSTERIAKMANSYHFWLNLWKIAIMVSSIRSNAYIKRQKTEAETNNKWLDSHLMTDNSSNSPSATFCEMVALDHKRQIDLINASVSVSNLFSKIHTPIALFIDNVDAYVNPVLEDRSDNSSLSGDTLYRNRNNTLWSIVQAALAGAAYAIHKTNSHVKVYCTIRREAFSQIADYDDQYAQILGSTIEIDYGRDDLEQIFRKNIDLTPADDLVDSGASDQMIRFFGKDNITRGHRFVESMERSFDYILRHTFYRPRDLMLIGGEISKINPHQRSLRQICDAVDRTSDDLVKALAREMSPFFEVPNFDLLFREFLSNTMTEPEVKRIEQKYLGDIAAQHKDVADHASPFAVLHKIGMLGRIQHDAGGQPRIGQVFLKPRDISVKDGVGLPGTERYYLVHPALDDTIRKVNNKGYMRNFHRENIIGYDLDWREPRASLFVLVGDVCGYSGVMNTEYYEIVTRKLHEWATSCCDGLDFFEVAMGDTLVLIDRSPLKLLRAARNFLARATGYRERPVTLRFGGAAGPVAFEEIGRRLDGQWVRITVPLGLALRTGARLEPLSRPGSVTVDDRFYEMSIGNFDDWQVTEVIKDDMPTFQYDDDSRQFAIRKNEKDPPYHSRLWRLTPPSESGAR